VLIDVAISGDRKSEAEKILKYRPYNRNTAHVECKDKCDTSKNRCNWNDFKTTQKIPEQNTGKHEIKELQKTALLSTAHIPWKVLM
jgi:hypothetical protein